MKPKVKLAAKSIGAVVIGATVGYVAGVLSAPGKGAETRRRIGKKVSDQTENIVRNAKQGMKDTQDRVKGAFARGEGKAAGAIATGERKVESAVTAFKRA